MTSIDLADLDAFAAIAATRSFRRAAKLRNVSASSLSAALQRLEGRLGVRLLNRTTRSVTVTEAGQRLLDRLAPALSEVTAALDAVNDFRDTPTGTLKLNVPTIVARQILPGIAARFLAAYPGITLEVSANDRFIDVLAAGFDAGIRYDESLERDMIRVPLGPRRQRFILAAAPVYVAQHGRPEAPQDVLIHACIRHRFDSGVMPPWEFERGPEVVKLNPAPRLIANNLEMELGAALAGVGLIYTFEEALAAVLANGRLAPLLDDWTPAFSGPFLYYPSRAHMPAPLRAFIDFIQAERA